MTRPRRPAVWAVLLPLPGGEGWGEGRGEGRAPSGEVTPLILSFSPWEKGPALRPVSVPDEARHWRISMALRRPSENRLNEIETMKIASPGSAATVGFT